MPLLLVGVTVPESFAGERERHTLPTLLASRLPDRAILFGKLATAIIYGWTVTQVILLVSLLVVNVVQREDSFAFYHPVVLVADVLISFLMSGLVASLGVLISLRSATAQGAQQALVFALLVPFMIVQVAPLLLMTAVPDGRAILNQLLAVDFGQVVLALAIVLVVADVVLLFAAMAQFKRAKLSAV